MGIESEHESRLDSNLCNAQYHNYQSLDNGQIRLLRPIGGQYDEQLRYKFTASHLDEKPSYNCLSYCWGDPALQDHIEVDRQPFGITLNLAAALRQIKRLDPEASLWVDAICINQSNIIEKGAQVGQMGSIYQQCSKLVIWLGDAENDSEQGMEAMQRFDASTSNHEWWQLDATTVMDLFGRYTDEALIAVTQILRRSYFERMWVLQEVCLSEAESIVVCGEAIISWKALVKFIVALGRADWTKDRGRFFNLIKQGYNAGSGENMVMVAKTAWETEMNLNSSAMTLKKNLWRFRSSKCSDARDKIYAILGICRDLRPSDIVPDYSLNTKEALYAGIRLMVEHENDISFLGACSPSFKTSAPLDLPSWIPHWQLQRAHAKLRPLVDPTRGVQQPIRHIFSAGTAIEAYIRVPDDRTTLTLTATFFDIVKIVGVPTCHTSDGSPDVTQAVQLGQCNDEWKALAEQHTTQQYPLQSQRQEAFLRTILSNLNKDGDTVNAANEELGYQHWLIARNQPTTPTALYSRFLHAFQQATELRRFFITDRGAMALGPRSMETGDVVYVPHGSQVPFVLRKKDDVTSTYTLIGECYVHGIMEGELFEQAVSGKNEARDIRIT